jgi:isoleucyl-tRNA synthetase
MPYAQWHYPFENRERIEERPRPGDGIDAARAELEWARRRQFPADFIAEGLDQTRGWFYSLLAISTLLPDVGGSRSRGTPYRNCVVIGLIQDAQGKKMSKSKGNVVDPWKVVDAEGADALRWYLVSAGSPDLPKRFSLEDVADAGRRYLGALENLYAFFALYAGIDGYAPSAARPLDATRVELTELDRWILARLQDVTDGVDRCLAEDEVRGYDPHGAAWGLRQFVIEDLSNWYVRRTRGRFWAGGVESDKIAAFDTLYKCLVDVAHLTAPLTPFIAEDLYQRLVVAPARAAAGPRSVAESVHLAPFPKTSVDRVYDEAEREFLATMDLVRSVVAVGRAARNDAGIKVRQPLRGARVALPAAKRRLAPSGPSSFKEILLDELNLNDVEFVDENALADRLRVSLRLKFDKFGPRLGKKAKAFAAAMQALPESSLWEYARGRLATIDVEGEPVALAGDEADVKREAVGPNEVYAQDGEIGFLLDTTITDALREKGFVREVINKVQFMRKEADFQVTDRIRIGIATASDLLRGAVERNRRELEAETLAVDVALDSAAGEHAREWDINGEPAEIGISRVAAPASPSGRSIGR